MIEKCNSQRVCCTKIEDFNVKINNEEIIKDVNLHLHCSQLTVVVGPNGAGKSTLLKAVLSDVSHTGKLFFESHNNHLIRKPVIGYVPQSVDFDKLFPMTVNDLIVSTMIDRPTFMGANILAKAEAEKVLEVVSAQNLGPKKIGQLSGGELQRVILALALNPLPDILLLDEPVSGIDQNGLRLFYQVVSELRRKYDITIILVSHDFSQVKKYADKVVLLDKTILVEGTPEEVFSSKEFTELFGEVV